MKTRDEWEKAASSLSFDGRAVINGARVATEKTSEDISPVTAKSLVGNVKLIKLWQVLAQLLKMAGPECPLVHAKGHFTNFPN